MSPHRRHTLEIRKAATAIAEALARLDLPDAAKYVDMVGRAQDSARESIRRVSPHWGAAADLPDGEPIGRLAAVDALLRIAAALALAEGYGVEPEMVGIERVEAMAEAASEAMIACYRAERIESN